MFFYKQMLLYYQQSQKYTVTFVPVRIEDVRRSHDHECAQVFQKQIDPIFNKTKIFSNTLKKKVLTVIKVSRCQLNLVIKYICTRCHYLNRSCYFYMATGRECVRMQMFNKQVFVSILSVKRFDDVNSFDNCFRKNIAKNTIIYCLLSCFIVISIFYKFVTNQ